MENADELFSRFEELNEIGAALSVERKMPVLFEKIVVAAKRITHADAGTLYLVSDDRCRLQFEIVRTDSLNIALGGTGTPMPRDKLPDLPLFLADGSANHAMVAVHAAVTGQTIDHAPS